MFFNIHDAREVTDITDSNNMREDVINNKTETNWIMAERARHYKLVLRKAVSCEK